MCRRKKESSSERQSIFQFEAKKRLWLDSKKKGGDFCSPHLTEFNLCALLFISILKNSCNFPILWFSVCTRHFNVSWFRFSCKIAFVFKSFGRNVYFQNAMIFRHLFTNGSNRDKIDCQDNHIEFYLTSSFA